MEPTQVEIGNELIFILIIIVVGYLVNKYWRV